MQTRSRRVKNYFDQTDNYLKNKFGIASRSSLINRNLPELKNKIILDIGCGNGEVTLPYIENNKITFLDLSDKMLDIVRSRIPQEYHQNAEFVNIDLDSFNYVKKYDYLFLIGVLAHVNSVEMTISKVSQLLDCDGTLIIQFTNSNNIISLIVKLLGEIKKMFGKSLNYKVNSNSFRVIRKELRKNKLEYFKKVNYWPSLPGFSLIPNRVRGFVQSKILNSKLIQPLGGEILLFVSNVRNNMQT